MSLYSPSRAPTWWGSVLFDLNVGAAHPSEWAGTLTMRASWQSDGPIAYSKVFTVTLQFAYIPGSGTSGTMSDCDINPVPLDDLADAVPSLVQELEWGVEPGGFGMSLSWNIFPNPASTVSDPYTVIVNLGPGGDSFWRGLIAFNDTTPIGEAPFYSAGTMTITFENNTSPDGWLVGPYGFDENVIDGGGDARFWTGFAGTYEDFPLPP